MSTIALLGNQYATLQTASNMGLASQVQVYNTTAAAILLTVAAVGTTEPSFPGTISIGTKQSVIIRKGPTDTIAGGTVGQLVATAVNVGG